jgi:hypothetical protein
MKLLSDGPDLHFLVRRDPDEVRARLADAVDAEQFLILGDKEFVGHVGPRTFRIRRNSAFRNAFRPYLSGRIEPILEGTRIVARLGLHPTTKFFMVAWLGAMLVIGLAVLVLFVTKTMVATLRGPDPRTMLMAPPLMFAACIAVAWIGRIWARGEEARLLQFAEQLWGPRVDPGDAE